MTCRPSAEISLERVAGHRSSWPLKQHANALLQMQILPKGSVGITHALPPVC